MYKIYLEPICKVRQNWLIPQKLKNQNGHLLFSNTPVHYLHEPEIEIVNYYIRRTREASGPTRKKTNSHQSPKGNPLNNCRVNHLNNRLLSQMLDWILFKMKIPKIPISSSDSLITSFWQNITKKSTKNIS